MTKIKFIKDPCTGEAVVVLYSAFKIMSGRFDWLSGFFFVKILEMYRHFSADFIFLFHLNCVLCSQDAYSGDLNTKKSKNSHVAHGS